MSEQEEKFRVDDRRRFDPETGEPRQVDDEEIALPGGGVLRSESEDEGNQLPVRFDDLLRPFYVMGLTGLGAAPHPDDGRIETNLALARTSIDVLELLRERTEGNRTAEESRVLEQALYTLKVRFVEVRDRTKR